MKTLPFVSIYINEQARMEEDWLWPCQVLVQKPEKQRGWEHLGEDGGAISGLCPTPSCAFSSEPEMGLCSIKLLRKNRDLRANMDLAWLFIMRKASSRLWPPWLCWSSVLKE